jgi:hypothetical protein
MPEGHQEHRTVPLTPAVALGGLDQLLDFALGEVFAWPKPTVGAAGRRNCPFYCCRGNQFEAGFCHMFQATRRLHYPYTVRNTDSDQGGTMVALHRFASTTAAND